MEISREDWLTLMNQARLHNVLPMIYDVVRDCPAMQSIDASMRAMFKKRMTYQVVLQTKRTAEFLALWQELRAAGLTPLVVKGIICRHLYPMPDYRLSTDEDVLIPVEQFDRCHEKMLELGMKLMDPEEDLAEAYEVSYIKDGSPIYIELHKSLFTPKSEVFRDWNRYFQNVFEDRVAQMVDGQEVLTLAPTDHLFYLICHSFKHFLHSGFGIRQVCDITMYAEAYGEQIDWDRIVDLCREIRAEGFCIALFRIGEKYLIFDREKACYPQVWAEQEVDETAMLEDLLCGGVYGNVDGSRLHSSNMTLHAVEAQKKGKKVSGNILRLVFPKAKNLQKRYPYLKKHPYLVPVAWVDRLLKYRKETSVSENNDAAESIRIGNQRIELLRQYGVLRE